MDFLNDTQAMSLAISEAKKGLGRVEPNPAVGCVILDKQRKLISAGYHQIFGGPHAEIVALKKVKDASRLKGAHLFVTLEPCAHYGKTPPCATKLSQYPLASVTYGIIDPNPQVKGKGHKILTRAGISAKKFKGETIELEQLVEKFSYAVKNKKSFVTLKLASSLDGQMGLASGESQWITSEESRNHANYLRAQHSAVLVGRETVEVDNPRLNVRLSQFKGHQNKVVILDPKGKLLKKIQNKNIYKLRDKNSVFIVTSTSVKPHEKYCQHLAVKMSLGSFDLEDLKALLYRHGIQSVLVEGGASTIAKFLEQKAAQKLALYMSPSIIGHRFGLNWAEHFGSNKLSKKINLHKISYDNIGPDILITGYFQG